VTTRSLKVTINLESAEIMRRLRRRYETSQESVRMAIGIAGIVVDAWEHGWPVVIERPNGAYRIHEARNQDQSNSRRVLSAVRPVYVHRNRDGSPRP
jgi:hypothetical protein